MPEVDEDKVFAALADKNRRKIVELLHEGDSTLQDLTGAFDISFQALSKHIKILEEAQLLNKTSRGKYRQLSLNRNGFRVSMEWIAYFSDFWNQSFDQLEAAIQQSKANDGE